MALRSREIEVDFDTLDDVAVARRAAQGDAAAFEVLYRRHAASAWRVAHAVANDREDAADAVSEAFTNLLHALAGGKLSPDIPFRPYLLVATRNAAIDQHRRQKRIQPLPALAASEPAATVAGPGERTEDSMDAGLVAEAFRSLPERWRSVLWLTEVEGIPARDVGARMGLTPNGAAQLAHRARSGLRERYLQAHLRHRPKPECVETVALLGAYASRTLPARATPKVEKHLQGCADCRERVAELSDVGGTLKAMAVPLPLLLAPLALNHYRLSFGLADAAAHARGLGYLARGTAAGERVTRSLAVTTSALLALGVITAGLMSGAGGPQPVPGSRSGGAVTAAPATNVSQLPGGGTVATPGAPGAGAGATDGGRTTEAPPRHEATFVAAPPPTTPPTTAPAQPNRKPTTPPTTTTPLLGVQLGANLAALSTSVSLGVGGGCTGVSLNGSKSCAPAAPASPGVSLNLTTPLGTVKVP